MIRTCLLNLTKSAHIKLCLSSMFSSISSSHYRKLSNDFGIDGSVTKSQLQNQVKNEYASVVYLATDAQNDFGVEGGFESIRELFPSSVHVPIALSSHTIFPPSDDNYPMIGAIDLYSRLSSAFAYLPKPIYVICRSNTRAGMALSAFEGIRKGLTATEVIDEAKKEGLAFVQSAGATQWVKTVVNTLNRRRPPLFIRQMFEAESSTYTYLVADEESGEALLIDPVLEAVERDSSLLKELGFKLKYAINTHAHADHITGTGLLKSKFDGCLSAISELSGAQADIKLKENDRLLLGQRFIFCVGTPGHTAGCLSFVTDDTTSVFTGDTLLIRGCGRTDFQGGSSSTLFDSVHNKLFRLPPSCRVLPAHDYRGQTGSTIGEEMKFNPRLNTTVSQVRFEEIMANLKLAYPKKIDEAVPRNMRCGF